MKLFKAQVSKAERERASSLTVMGPPLYLVKVKDEQMKLLFNDKGCSTHDVRGNSSIEDQRFCGCGCYNDSWQLQKAKGSNWLLHQLELIWPNVRTGFNLFHCYLWSLINKRMKLILSFYQNFVYYKHMYESKKFKESMEIVSKNSEF